MNPVHAPSTPHLVHLTVSPAGRKAEGAGGLAGGATEPGGLRTGLGFQAPGPRAHFLPGPVMPGRALLTETSSGT